MEPEQATNVAQTSEIYSSSQSSGEYILETPKNSLRKRKSTTPKERRIRANAGIQQIFKSCQLFVNRIAEKLNAKTTETPGCDVLQDSQGISHGTSKELTSCTKPLKYFEGDLYPYQLEGVKFFTCLFECCIGGLLADEMGLGKTIQIIALICNLIEKKVRGPFLILAPVSTLPNWVAEFRRFAPKIPVRLLYGEMQERFQQKMEIQKMSMVDDFETYPVVITSYSTPFNEKSFLLQFDWQYLIVDEGHRIKNFESKLSRFLRELTSFNRIIVTGTPLQNNLIELWSLLNFLLPATFLDVGTFSDLFELEEFHDAEHIIELEQNTNIISTLRGILESFMVRRLKSEVLKNIPPKKEVLVYCSLTYSQSQLYKDVILKNVYKLLGRQEEKIEIDYSKTLVEGRKKRKCTLQIDGFYKENYYPGSPHGSYGNMEFPKNSPPDKVQDMNYNIKMGNPIMLLRKIVNHPYTVQCPLIPGTKDRIVSEQLVRESGKMMVLDAMLKGLKERNHKVLIFSSFVETLDLMEDLMELRSYKFCRLDGRCPDLKDRENSINSFNNSPDIFVFLLSTRAGGQGINLTSADTVIMYDREWNPQMDIQAHDRCHRIGQEKPVMIYSLVTKDTVEDSIINTAGAKRRLEKAVIQGGMKEQNGLSDEDELQRLLKCVDSQQIVFSDDQLNALLDRSDLYRQMELPSGDSNVTAVAPPLI